MGVPGAGSGQGSGPNLRVSATSLTKLAGDLDDMQDHLDKQVQRMDAIVDRIEAGWRGPAASAYRDFHRAAAEDAVRIREVMKLLEEAVRLSRDGFSQDDLEVLAHMRQIQVDVDSEVARLSTPNTEPPPSAAPRSSLDSF
ncbi:WXG100 family type VII secretion target [Streptomyces sp. ID05-04B]|uniref:WXG100 family type VII secretion target n=1 Tax=unclassified Streptomyces TaxID=2593676 RepID=UPI000D198DD8|nr:MULTISPECIES: WXG100 family type VII secretion target [unclassified Streptomyces]AVV40185.1 WXG100 family type VII secretion target [Streptomyces sp. P3]MDX5569341.1 WXG100 family type VII secretion target [Streptomyces sp. ID05-04B]